jgi:hypothetical protein
MGCQFGYGGSGHAIGAKLQKHRKEGETKAD